MSDTPLDDRSVLSAILTDTECLLLDFDGPICSVFSHTPARQVATKLREALAKCGHNKLPIEIETSEDPFEVFHYAATMGDDEARHIEATLSALETSAVQSAKPTAGSHDLILQWRMTNRRLVIVSNNSESAVRSYLRRHRIPVDAVSSRTLYRPALLKPNPFLVDQARRLLDCSPTSCTLIGDSHSDLQAARAAGVKFIGYANKPHKLTSLGEGYTSAVITDINHLVSVLINTTSREH